MPFIRLNVQKQDQIKQISTNGINIVEARGDEKVGFGVKHRGESVEDETCMVQRELEGVSEGRRVDSLSGGRYELLLQRG